MDPSGSKRKGGLIPATFTLSVRRRKKSYYRSGERRQRLNDQATSSIIKKILPGNGQEIPQF